MEESCIVEEISMHSANLAKAVTKTSSNAKETGGAATGLAKLSETLHDLVGKFKV